MRACYLFRAIRGSRNEGVLYTDSPAERFAAFFVTTSGGASDTPSLSEAAPNNAHSAEAIQKRTTILFSAQPRN